MSDFDVFQNSGYTNNRNRKRTLILDVDDSATADTHLGSGGEFKVKLFEPLIIDKHSEVYLDNCFTLPHIGSGNIETRLAMSMRAVNNIEAHFESLPYPSRVI